MLMGAAEARALQKRAGGIVWIPDPDIFEWIVGYHFEKTTR
jgi:hypothetical protein